MAEEGDVVVKRTVIAPDDREEVAIISIAMPAGSELEIPVMARFHGFLRKTERRKKVERLTVARRIQYEVPYVPEDDDA